MLKILLWVVSNDGRFFQGALNILERQHNGIELVGLTAHVPINIVANGKNIPFVPLNKIGALGGGYDVLLVVGAKKIGMSKITQAARQLNLPVEKLLADWIVCIPGFALDKYRRLQRSQLSIFSLDCFGGIISNTLGLPFYSPFINMRLDAQDYIRFLRAPRIYLEEKLFFKDKALDDNKFYYPIFTLGNIDLNMIHYRNFDEAEKKWYDRKQKINWYNLFVTMYTEDEKILQEFDALPYGKKVCFVPFKSDLNSAWYIDVNFYEEYKHLTLGHIVRRLGWIKVIYYDLFDMLLYGKKTPLIKM